MGLQEKLIEALRAGADNRFSDIAGELRGAEWAARNPPAPLDPDTQRLIDLLMGKR